MFVSIPVPSQYGIYRMLTDGDRAFLVDLTLPEKPTYVEIPRDKFKTSLDKITSRSASVQAKIDGVMTMVALMKNGVRILSHRRRKSTGTYEDYTRKIGLKPTRVPKKYRDAVLGGEFVLVDPETGRPKRPEESAGFLYRQEPKSEDEKKKIYLFDLLSDKSDWYTRRKKLEEIAEWLKAKYPELFEVTEHYDPSKAEELFETVTSGKYPLTREGIVLHRKDRPGGWKVKGTEDTHVYIRGVIPITKGKGVRTGAGALLYSLEPEGEIVGKIGTGLTDELRKDIMEHPEDYIGRKARIKHYGKTRHGAYRHPVLVMIE